MTRAGQLVATRGADTEVFYMAGRQLAALSRRLIGAGWPPHTPVAVVSRAGWPDQHGSDHQVDTLPEAVVLHGGRPTVVIVGIGATALAAAPAPAAGAISLPPTTAASKP
jgi:uroporphyrin-III C-methyltransferase